MEAIRHFLAYVAAVYYVATLAWFIIGLRTFLWARKKFRNQLDEDQRRKFRAFDRMDFDIKTSDIAWLCVGAVLLMPFRLAILLGTAASNVFWLQVFAGRCTLDVTLKDFHSVTQRQLTSQRALRDRQENVKSKRLLKFLVQLHCRIETWILGVWTIREWKVLNCNFDFPQDQKDQLFIEPLTDQDKCRQYATTSFVSNHISIVDTLFFITRLYPSFLAKSSLFYHCLIGPCARALNCVFLNRQSSQDRERTVKVLMNRHNEIWKISVDNYLHGKDRRVRVSEKMQHFIEIEKGLRAKSEDKSMNADLVDAETPPLLIFPEGTTSCGRHLIPLKRGAFLGLRPITPAVLIYRCPQFNVSYDIMPLFWTLPLMLSYLRPVTLDVYWLREVLPPPPSGGDAAKRIEEMGREVRKRMSRVLLAEAHWEMPVDEKLPEAWEGSMKAKMECIHAIFGK